MEWRVHRFVGGASVLLALAYSFHVGSGGAFGRSGSIMCLMGGFMTFRRFLRGMDDRYLRDTGRANLRPFGFPDPMVDPDRESSSDGAAMKWGIIYIILGTMIWGYSDLLFHGTAAGQ
jgi:hypothetical protein